MNRTDSIYDVTIEAIDYDAAVNRGRREQAHAVREAATWAWGRIASLIPHREAAPAGEPRAC